MGKVGDKVKFLEDGVGYISNVIEGLDHKDAIYFISEIEVYPSNNLPLAGYYVYSSQTIHISKVILFEEDNVN